MLLHRLQPAWLVLDGKRWLFDEASWELADWFVIKNATGLGRVSFLNGVMDEDPAAMQALVWFLRRRDEPDLAVAQVSFRMSEIEYEAVEDEPTDPPPAGGAADAEPPKNSGPDGTTTSPPSPASTATPAGMSTP